MVIRFRDLIYTNLQLYLPVFRELKYPCIEYDQWDYLAIVSDSISC